jgi:hypothetical protein
MASRTCGRWGCGRRSWRPRRGSYGTGLRHGSPGAAPQRGHGVEAITRASHVERRAVWVAFKRAFPGHEAAGHPRRP